MIRKSLLLLSLLISSSYAQEYRYLSYEKWDFAFDSKGICGEEKNQTLMNSCLAHEYEKVDKELNKVYQELMVYVKKAELEENLISAQKAWLKFRDLDCLLTSPPQGGSLDSFSANSCLIDKTEKRIKDLKKYIGYTGCNGCPW